MSYWLLHMTPPSEYSGGSVSKLFRDARANTFMQSTEPVSFCLCVYLPLSLLLFHPAFKPSFHSSHVIRTSLSCLYLTLLKSLFILELNCLPVVIRSFPRVQTLWSAPVCLRPHTRPHIHTHTRVHTLMYHTTSLLRAECVAYC